MKPTWQIQFKHNYQQTQFSGTYLFIYIYIFKFSVQKILYVPKWICRFQESHSFI